MLNPKDLTTRQLKEHIEKQKMWQETYRKVDPSSLCIVTCQEIISELEQELAKRGVKHAT